MSKVLDSVIKEQYLLKSTFFYNKLTSNGYFDLFLHIQKYANIEGGQLDWGNKNNWGISNNAWEIIKKNNILPVLIFAHPKVLKLNPTYLKYYRSVAMIPQKGLKSISHISNIEAIEDGRVDANKLTNDTINKLIVSINEVVSLVIELSSGLNESKIQGMMYATAGTNIEGSWRNQIGAEGERVIRTLILKELFIQNEITSIMYKNGNIREIAECKIDAIVNEIDLIKTINLINGYSIFFSSEPDVTMYNSEGGIVGIIEIKSGLDTAGALERLGAMFKSFENTLAEYPDAITILVASCITDEVESRLGATTVVRQKFVTTKITANETEKRKFVNRLRAIMKLTSKTL